MALSRSAAKLVWAAMFLSVLGWEAPAGAQTPPDSGATVQQPPPEQSSEQQPKQPPSDQPLSEQQQALQRPAPLPQVVQPIQPPRGPSPEDQALAHDLIPGLIEIGADLRPVNVGVLDDGSNVLAAVNALRRQDGLPRFDRLDENARRYVANKVAAFREARARVIRMQYALSALGFAPGPIDGYFGPLTSHAVQMYQKAYGLPITGKLSGQDIEALDELRIAKAVSAVMTAPAPPGSVPQDTSPLTKPEIAKIRQQIEACWKPPTEARDLPELIVRLHLSFSEDGSIRSAEILNRGVLTTSLARRVGDSAVRAVFDPNCSPYELPDKPYAVWKDVKLVLSPSLMD